MPLKTLRDDQIADLAFFINNPKAALLNDPATGKTPTMCVYSEYCWQHLGLKTVWTQPLGLMQKNFDEMLEFTDFKPEDLVLVQGSKEKKFQQMTGPGKVFFMSADGWSRNWKTMVQAHPELRVSISDELHLYYRGHTAKRTQSWYRACNYMHSVVPMTGSLIRGKLSSAYPTVHVLFPTAYGSYEAFEAQHALVDEYGKPFGWKNHEKLKKVLAAVSIRRTFESIHGVEKPFIQVIKCPMGDMQRKKYQAFHEMGVLELSDQWMESKGGGADWIRALQIMAHPENVKLPTSWDEDGKPIAFKEYNLLGRREVNGKDEALKAYIEEHLATGDPLVIYASLIPEQMRIFKMIEKMGGKVGLINSTVTGARRQLVDIDFKNGTIQFVVGSPATCSTGFNWQEIRKKNQIVELGRIIFVSLSPDDTDFTQAFKRGIRRKRQSKLEVIILEYEDSLDQRIFQIVESKSKEAHQVDETQAEVFMRNTIPDTVNVGQAKVAVPPRAAGTKLTMGDMRR